MTTIQLTLTVDEVNAVLAALGQLPTNVGVYPLAVRLKAEAEAQLPAPATEEAAVAQ
jgi:hypothetical protein